jgi:hypothetical protein
VINLVDVRGDAGVLLSEITRAFVRQYLANAAMASISFIHTVTAPSALRMMAAHLSGTTLQNACATHGSPARRSTPHTGFAPAAYSEPPESQPFSAPDLIDQAIASRDEHAIKFTEACLREYAIKPDAAFITAARDAVERLRQ